MKARNILAALTLSSISIFSIAQCDAVANECESHITTDYISDGQNYWALLYDDQVAEFNVTLFGGSTYRIAACSGQGDGNLIFSMYDQDKNLLFTNRDHVNAPYWDFVLDSSIDCTIEAQLDLNKQESGCAVIQIGFKQ